jgi:hypothetical protein
VVGRKVDVIEPPSTVLHRCTRNLRLANLSLASSIAKISSTHSRSCAITGCESAPLEFNQDSHHELNIRESFTQLRFLITHDAHPCNPGLYLLVLFVVARRPSFAAHHTLKEYNQSRDFPQKRSTWGFRPPCYCVHRGLWPFCLQGRHESSVPASNGSIVSGGGGTLESLARVGAG